ARQAAARAGRGSAVRVGVSRRSRTVRPADGSPGAHGSGERARARLVAGHAARHPARSAANRDSLVRLDRRRILPGHESDRHRWAVRPPEHGTARGSGSRVARVLHRGVRVRGRDLLLWKRTAFTVWALAREPDGGRAAGQRGGAVRRPAAATEASRDGPPAAGAAARAPTRRRRAPTEVRYLRAGSRSTTCP